MDLFGGMDLKVAAKPASPAKPSVEEPPLSPSSAFSFLNSSTEAPPEEPSLLNMTAPAVLDMTATEPVQQRVIVKKKRSRKVG